MKQTIRETLSEFRKVIARVEWFEKGGAGHFVTIVDVEKRRFGRNNLWTVLDSLSGTEEITMPSKDGFVIYQNKKGMKGFLDFRNVLAVS